MVYCWYIVGIFICAPPLPPFFATEIVRCRRGGKPKKFGADQRATEIFGLPPRRKISVQMKHRVAENWW